MRGIDRLRRCKALQFDWSRECDFIGSPTRMPLEVAHVTLAFSRAFWLVAYPTQIHEMLSDTQTIAFAASGGMPRRGICNKMKTVVVRIGHDCERLVNARFHAMNSHYPCAAEFCN